ncbi:MAG: nucleoside hydrolase [Solobacterium sp.]|nr:nucleoside hydrolase [Solobacterium sp.]
MNNEKKIPLILDGDPGHDDAIAWVIAASDPRFEVKAITAVAGNQTLAKVSENARKIAALLNLDVEVAMGRDIPLLEDLMTGGDYHGTTGLDGPVLPDPVYSFSELSAVEMMAKVLQESEEPVIIIATGPQTNVAALLLTHPELKEKIRLISIMGGGLRNGNWTSTAEFNILNDPESAYIEFHAGVPLLMCGLDVTEQAIIYPEEWEEIRKLGNPVAETVASWLDFFIIKLKELGWDGATLHDPCAVLALIHPEIFTMKDCYVEIVLDGEYTRGMTMADYRGTTGNPPNCRVVTGIDRKKFVEYLKEACSKFGKEEQS